jgi:hypothetical protein
MASTRPLSLANLSPRPGTLMLSFSFSKLNKPITLFLQWSFDVSAWLGYSPIIQPNTQLDIAVKVFCRCD